MKTFTLIRRAIPLLFLFLFVKVHAQTNQPVNCNGQFFVSHGAGTQTTNATALETLTFPGGLVTPATFGTSPATHAYNALGINPFDGYIYALRYESSNGASGTGGGVVQLIRIGKGAANVNIIGQVNSSSAGNPLTTDVYAGCFNATGVYYFIDNQNNLFSLPLTNLATNGSNITRTATYLGDLSGSGDNIPPTDASGKIVDIAINPVTGIMYGVSYGSSSSTVANSYRLYQIGFTGALTRLGAAGNNTTGQYPHPNNEYIAALFFTEDGSLYGYRSGGQFLKLNVATPQTSSNSGVGPAYTAADGCSCSFRIGHTLKLQAIPGQFCPTNLNNNQPVVPLNVAVSNSSGAARSGLSFTLDISDPKHRFRFTQSLATIESNLLAAGLLPNANGTHASFITATFPDGTNHNKLVINDFQIPFGAATYNFSMDVQLYTLGTPYTPVYAQSTIGGLPAGLGSSDLSGNGIQPHAPTLLAMCNNIGLPVTLLNFSGTYKDNAANLNWETANQVDFDHFEIERSGTGSDFQAIGHVQAKYEGSALQYAYKDDLSSAGGNAFYYRLKMVDINGEFKYSNVIMIRKEQSRINGISINPNPVIRNGMATVRFTSVSSSVVDFRVLDMTGKVVLKQQNRVNDGNNSIALNSIDRLQPGIYVLQMNDGSGATMTAKFSIVR